MRTNHGIRLTLGVVTTLALVGAFAAVSWAGAPQFGDRTASLAPNPEVTTGSDVLYNVTYPYNDQQTLTRSEIRITFPLDWDFVPPAAADPDVCTQTGETTLTCARGTIRSGDVVNQAVKFKTGPVGPRTVSSILTFFEQASQGDKGRTDFVPAPDADVNVVPASDNQIAKCAAKGGEQVATKGGISATNALTTTMFVPATTALCSPVSAQEFPAGSSVSACPAGVECTTEVAVTSAPLFPTTNPIKLIFDIFGKPKNWYMDGVLVPACTGTGATPDPCISGRSNLSKGLRLTVLWSGVDPSWEGA